VHLSHVADYHSHREPSWHSGTRPHPLAQRLQRHQLKLANAEAFSIDKGSQLPILNLELAARIAVGDFPKSGKFSNQSMILPPLGTAAATTSGWVFQSRPYAIAPLPPPKPDL
jgi:hypothetical protein